MPIYSFKCPSCAHSFDALVKVGVTVAPCKQCQTESVKQLSAPGSFNLQGDGFYKPSARPVTGDV